ncbi:Zinc finger/binuclear cluster transcriptional regulator [Mycena chlorophos]|uniref:Zinc finger/binuclear cluster transcriptional regulator n=1 Tax=Mycena chlorophos TaxID=658473 RepID=A0A8H6TKA3_MYCCL|nr:Zinc finger/binuclear cluster transcriptional regulator [Mycena chlorophos]
MGGDHKCPVCQATFTRPQHVARHMRSHTGDRPYKCVHCGDQFARSDLLSRHVNKCHAGASKPNATAGGRRKGTTAASRATTSKQACDQCVQSSLPCDGSNPCGKCISRKTRCTFVKFHRQTAPVGPGHATSLSASLPTPSSLANYGLHGPGSGAPPPFLYAQSAASGAGFAYSSPAPLNASPTATNAPPYPVPPGSREGIPFAHQPHGHGHFAPDYRDGYDYDRYDYDNGLDASSEHSGSVSTGSRPASSAGLSDYAGYHHNLQGSHSRQASLDMHSHHSALDMQHHPHSRPPAHDPHSRPPEFSSAFGLMSLDDPNVLAGLANDGVPFFSTNSPVAAHAQPHDKRLPPPIPLQLPLLPAPPPLQFHPQSQSQAGGTREAETRELREFWKAYMRTPLTGPSPGTAAPNNDPLAHGLSLGLGLGMQTPSASANNAAVAAAAAAGGMLAVPNSGTAYAGGGPTPRRHRVSSLPSVRTPEGEIDARMVFPALPPTHTHHQHPPIPPPPPVSVARTMHNADDLRSYEAAVLARKAPELVLRKPAKRDRGSPPTTNNNKNNATGQPPAPPPAQSQSPPQPHSQFDFNAMSRESSSLAGAFGGKSFGYGGGALPPPPRTGSASSTSNPASPLPHTPSSSDDGDRDRDHDREHEHEVESSVGSAHDDSDHDSGASSIGRPSFKRLPSQTLEPVYAKRRKEYVPRHGPGGLTLGLDTPTQDGAGGGGAASEGLLGHAAAGAYGYAAAHERHENGKPPSSRQRGRRLSAPASPTALGFVIN